MSSTLLLGFFPSLTSLSQNRSSSPSPSSFLHPFIFASNNNSNALVISQQVNVSNDFSPNSHKECSNSESSSDSPFISRNFSSATLSSSKSNVSLSSSSSSSGVTPNPSRKSKRGSRNSHRLLTRLSTQVSFHSKFNDEVFSVGTCGTLHEAKRQLEQHLAKVVVIGMKNEKQQQQEVECCLNHTSVLASYSAVIYGISGERQIMQWEIDFLLDLKVMLRKARRDYLRADKADDTRVYVVKFLNGGMYQIYDSERDVSFKMHQLEHRDKGMRQQTLHSSTIPTITSKSWKAPALSLLFWTDTFLDDYCESQLSCHKYVDVSASSKKEFNIILKHMQNPFHMEEDPCEDEPPRHNIVRISTSTVNMVPSLKSCFRDVMFTQLFSLRSFTGKKNEAATTRFSCSPHLMKHYMFRLIAETVQRLDIMSFELNEVELKMLHFLRRVKFLYRFMYSKIPAESEVYRSRNAKALMKFVMEHGMVKLVRGNASEKEIQCHMALSLFIFLRDFEKHLVRQLGTTVSENNQCVFASSMGKGGITLGAASVIRSQDFGEFFALVQQVSSVRAALHSFDDYLVDHSGEARKIIDRHLQDQDRFQKMINQDRSKQETLLMKRLLQTKQNHRQQSGNQSAEAYEQKEVTTKRPPAPTLRMPPTRRKSVETSMTLPTADIPANTDPAGSSGSAPLRSSAASRTNQDSNDRGSFTAGGLSVRAMLSLTAVVAVAG
eukprot:CAMPEP_0117455272 /NCGR_PEP_ID=MMETSP0759-20121206/11272_1 /TAXON_ID=63605 /ORGANISM="Percolomonas cosmopolitus, Strain WS" /LENGTH=719 /DNA_ID=CAMNT_0005248567 /DNA_START=1652 /DNA_END=3807 /DNA_ORIENTATION=-